MTVRIALFPGKARAGRWRSIPAVPARVGHASEGSHPFLQARQQPTTMKRIARNQTAKTARIDLEISVEAQRRFAEIHKTLGYKTKPETFEAIVYSASMQDKLDPGIIQRIDAKLDHALEILDSLT
jgi:hypothetical protein